jgi:hypothetical protein
VTDRAVREERVPLLAFGARVAQLAEAGWYLAAAALAPDGPGRVWVCVFEREVPWLHRPPVRVGSVALHDDP